MQWGRGRKRCHQQRWLRTDHMMDDGKTQHGGWDDDDGMEETVFCNLLKEKYKLNRFQKYNIIIEEIRILKQFVQMLRPCC